MWPCWRQYITGVGLKVSKFPFQDQPLFLMLVDPDVEISSASLIPSLPTQTSRNMFCLISEEGSFQALHIIGSLRETACENAKHLLQPDPTQEVCCVFWLLAKLLVQLSFFVSLFCLFICLFVPLCFFSLFPLNGQS